MSKSVTFGISHPFILSETPVDTARAAVIDVANALLDGHEEHNPEVTPAGESGLDGVPSVSFNIPVLVDDDNPLPAYDLLPQLLADVRGFIPKNGHIIELPDGNKVCTKRRYSTLGAAASALAATLASPNGNRHERRIYHCRDCHAFHLTSMEHRYHDRAEEDPEDQEIHREGG